MHNCDFKPKPNSLNAGKLWNNIKSYSGKTWQVGSNKFRLDKQGVEHIFQRHHPDFWDGSEKAMQSFLPSNWKISDVENAIVSVMKQNRDKLANRTSNSGMFQIHGTYNGMKITVGFKDGKVGQFYTKK